VPPESVEEQWDLPGLEKVLEASGSSTLPIARRVERATSTDETIASG
jgi:preprotein translocase subunit SecA